MCTKMSKKKHSEIYSISYISPMYFRHFSHYAYFSFLFFCFIISNLNKSDLKFEELMLRFFKSFLVISMSWFAPFLLFLLLFILLKNRGMYDISNIRYSFILILLVTVLPLKVHFFKSKNNAHGVSLV